MADNWQLANGINKDNLSESRGAEVCAKRVIFGGFFGKRGVRMGHLRASKQAKSHLFARRWDGRGHRGYFGA